jgi:hypothetical protein
LLPSFSLLGSSSRSVGNVNFKQEASVVDATGEQLRQIRDVGASAVDPAVVKDLQKRQLVALGYALVHRGGFGRVVL